MVDLSMANCECHNQRLSITITRCRRHLQVLIPGAVVVAPPAIQAMVPSFSAAVLPATPVPPLPQATVFMWFPWDFLGMFHGICSSTENGIYPVNICKHHIRLMENRLNMTIELVDLPMKNRDFQWLCWFTRG